MILSCCSRTAASPTTRPFTSATRAPRRRQLSPAPQISSFVVATSHRLLPPRPRCSWTSARTTTSTWLTGVPKRTTVYLNSAIFAWSNTGGDLAVILGVVPDSLTINNGRAAFDVTADAAAVFVSGVSLAAVDDPELLRSRRLDA